MTKRIIIGATLVALLVGLAPVAGCAFPYVIEGIWPTGGR